MRLIAILLALLLGAGVLMLSKAQIGGTAPQVAAAPPQTDGAEAPKRTVADVVNERRANMRPWSNAAAESDVFDLSRFSDKRGVRVEMIIPFFEMLTEGEDPPERPFHGVYAAARAPAQLARLCTEVVETIAIACDVAVAKAKLVGENKDKVSLTGFLRYLPRDEAGTAPGTDVVARVMDLPLSYRGGTLTYNTAKGRIGYLRMVRNACDMLRDLVGNCVIRNVTFQGGTGVRRQGKGTMEVSARLAVYADQAAVDDKAIDAAFQTLTGTVELFRRNGT